MTSEEVKKQQTALSAKVMSLAAGTLMLNMRYMSKAVSRLPARPYEGSYACRGKVMNYDPAYLLRRYKQSEKLPVHDCLHMLMHCVFRHWHVGGGIDSLRWDAACDIAVEAAIMKVAAGFADNERIAEKSAVILELSTFVRPLTAEKLYAYFSAEDFSEEKLAEYVSIFSVDDHKDWYPEPLKESEDEDPPMMFPDFDEDKEPQPDDGNDDDSDGDGEEQPDDKETRQKKDDEEDGSDGKSGDESLEQWLANERQMQQEQLDEMWKDLAKEIKSELENFGKENAPDSAYLVQMLDKLDRERVDYAGFLRRFAVSGEVIRADLDSFEPGFYSYGMSLYGNVALIEPPEYKETFLVRDFVIAIDTSGSVRGELVQKFMQKTYNILKSTESFFAQVNIYMIQCDTEVRDAVRIGSEAELEAYIQKAELKGLGGTDFRPVFDYVDELRAGGQLTGLRGLVYFTDGFGQFPENAPGYDAAFAFIGETEAVVPPWAYKLELEEEDIIYD